MSDTPAFTSTTPPAPRPVSLFTIVAVLVLFAAFFFVVCYLYSPVETAPQNAAAENMGKELEWRSTSVSRRATLAEVRQANARQATSYGWVDQKAGVVRLPIERAMELTVEQYRGKKPERPENPPRKK
ncbi:MAG: hypothetical protein Q7S40_23840 [Opitutaceae bacterium]|nr:hypothetical protein [Opitutaceae bacterium]